MGNERNNETKRKKTSNLNKEAKSKTKNKKIKFKDKHPKVATGIKIGLVVFMLLMIIGAGVLAGTFFGIFGDELKISEESLVVGYENSTVYDADGNLIATLSGGTKRKSVSLSEMSEYLPKAYVSIEDERFYSHSGIDIKRTAAATATYVIHGGKSSFGGSTITQQVIKNITKEKDNTALAGVMRKVKEISKSIQVEHYLSKDQILELYLNLIFVGGDDVNGVELGSIYYFDKSASELSIAECAYMAGINHSPNAYKPFEDYAGKEDAETKKQEMKEKINKRTKTVLKKMNELAYINEEQYNQAIAEVDAGLNFKKGESASVTTDVSYHTEAAIAQIIDQIMEENEDMSKDMAEMYLYSSGFKIYTTQKTDIQTRLEEELVKDKYITKTTYTDKDPETKEKVKKTQYSWPTMVIMDHKTGSVVASATATGSAEERTARTKLGYFNIPTSELKQTGSSMKPIAVIAPGLETGTITGATVYDDNPTKFPGSPPWEPKEYYSGWKGLMNIRTAIEISANIPHAKALADIGLKKSVEFCQSIGLPEFKNEGLSLSLGGLSKGVSVYQMAGAYSAIANDGVYITPTFYTKVTDSSDNIVYEPKQEPNKVMSEQNAYIEKNILTQPVVGGNGTATYCAIPGMDVAAKTGTTSDDFDRWLCGFTPYYTAAVWYGYQHSETVRYSGNPAGKIWDAVMTDIHKDLPNAKFEQPQGVITKAVCRTSGKLATEACGANVYNELFTEKNVPKESCEGHVKVRICLETGLVANEFCTQVEERLYTARPEHEQTTKWTTTGGAYDVPTDTCTAHTAAPAQPEQPAQPEPTPAETTTPNPGNTPAQHTHQYAEIITKEPNCTQTGTKTLKCSCGDTKTQTINALGHAYGEWVTDTQPTATTAGSKHRTCSRCNNTETASIPATGEGDTSSNTTTPPTDTKPTTNTVP